MGQNIMYMIYIHVYASMVATASLAEIAYQNVTYTYKDISASGLSYVHSVANNREEVIGKTFLRTVFIYIFAIEWSGRKYGSA